MTTECPRCNGGGEVQVSCRNSRAMDPPMQECGMCYGSGKVDDDEEHDENRDYEADAKEAYEDARREAAWEREREGDL